MKIRVERERGESHLKHCYHAEGQWPVGILTKIIFSFLCEDVGLKFKIPTLVQEQQGAIW